ncbi:hypothetical protein QOT17_014223 [Balamuthia mandrillaris]
MELQAVVELIKQARFEEASKQLYVEYSHSFVFEEAEQHGRWREQCFATLKSLKVLPQWDSRKRTLFWNCLRQCFEILDQEEDALACHYEMLRCQEHSLSWEDWTAYGHLCYDRGLYSPALEGYAEAINCLCGSRSSGIGSLDERAKEALAKCYENRSQCLRLLGREGETEVKTIDAVLANKLYCLV